MAYGFDPHLRRVPMTLDDWKEYTAEELLEKVENKEIRYSTR